MSYLVCPNLSPSPVLTIERVVALKDVIKWHHVFLEAGLNPSTMRSAMHTRRPLRDDEVSALSSALVRRGIHVCEQTELFPVPHNNAYHR